MLTIELDWSSSQPVYRQICDQLRGLIARGELREGAELPSVRQLSAAMNVNLNTVAKAYRALADEGLVDLRHGARARVQRAASVADLESLERQLDAVISRLVLSGARRNEVRDLLERALDRFLPDEHRPNRRTPC